MQPAFIKFFIILNWTLWAVMAFGWLHLLIANQGAGGRTPEGSSALAVFLGGVIIFFIAATAALVWWAARKQSLTGLILMALVFSAPNIAIWVRAIVMPFKNRHLARAKTQVGDFPDPALKAIASAFKNNDTSTLKQLLNGQPPLDGRDAAGNSLLAYALDQVRDHNANPELLRILLDAGTNVRTGRVGTGEFVLNYMALNAKAEVVQVLLDHGADPNVIDEQTGETPLFKISDAPDVVRLLVEHGAEIDRVRNDGFSVLVSLIQARQWDAAIYLVDQGANLEVTSASGRSVDWYLNEWKQSVYDTHPEGWPRLVKAIERRRATNI